MDTVTREKRSEIMQKVHSKDTKPEIIVRKYLFNHGLRFRVSDKRYPGHPDIVLPKYRTIIFVNGCFWHQHKGCKRATIPENNHDYWEKKLLRNVERDKENITMLEDMGWQVLTVWECELRKKCIDKTLDNLLTKIKSNIKVNTDNT